MQPMQEERSSLDGFLLHMYMAFREFDLMFYETYVFTVVFAIVFLWFLTSGFKWIYARCCDPNRGENKALRHLKDDLI